MTDSATDLQVLVADEREGWLDRVAEVVRVLGHRVVARVVTVREVARVSEEERPDVALVGMDDDPVHALRLIEELVRDASCPVICLLGSHDAAFVREAAKRGVFACLNVTEPHELQAAIEVVLRRFAEYHSLEGAFRRRALTERAKGILMQRHGIDERAAFELLRRQARRSNRRLEDVADALLESHGLLERPPDVASEADAGAPR